MTTSIKRHDGGDDGWRTGMETRISALERALEDATDALALEMAINQGGEFFTEEEVLRSCGIVEG